jgi:mono/diheme cytochrome c family protein
VKHHHFLLAALLASAIFPGLAAVAESRRSEPSKKTGSDAAPVVRSTAQDDVMRLDGEQRFRTNCGRCHAAPHKFPPRMMATIVRHMRVRATITDEDMRLILHYMTQ